MTELVTIPRPNRDELPDTAWRSLRDYRDAMQGTTEASDVAHLTTCLAAASANLGRNVWMYDGRLIYANGFYGFIGETDDKKTTAQRRVDLLLDESVQVIKDDGSVEGICDYLVTTKEEPTKFLLLREEMGTIFSHRKSMQNSQLVFVTRMFDCPPAFQLLYRKRPIHLHNPTPTIYGCSTASWLAKHIREDDFHGGVLNRFLLLSGKKKDPIPSPISPSREAIERVRSRFVALARLRHGELRFSKRAAELYDEFYIDFRQQERDELLEAGLKRLLLYARKISMAHACLEGTAPEITADQLAASLIVVQHAARCMETFVRYRREHSDPYFHLEEWFTDWLSEPGYDGMEKRKIQMTTSKKFGSARKFNMVLDTLAKAGRIKIDGVPSKVYLIK